MEKGIPEVFSDGVNPKIKFSRNKSIFHTITHSFRHVFALHKSQKHRKDYFYRNSYNKWVKLLKYNY